MADIRAQYHLRRTREGIDAFSVQRLIRLSQGLPVRMVDPNGFVELDENHWYHHTRNAPTPRSILEHLSLVLACDVNWPIILDQQGRVMDGMHRICRAILEHADSIPAVQFVVDPAPDFVNCNPESLPYDD